MLQEICEESLLPAEMKLSLWEMILQRAERLS